MQFIYQSTKLLTIILISTNYGIGKAPRHTNIIKLICLESFNDQITHMKTKANQKIGDFACDCFIEEVKSGSSILSAKSTCKKKAEKKFKI